jgi:hypothetical protein
LEKPAFSGSSALGNALLLELFALSDGLLVEGQDCRQAIYVDNEADSCKFFQAPARAQMFWYNPNILSNQAFTDSKPSGRVKCTD